jgi:hypothetical protein
MCGEIEQRWICPLATALTTGEIGRIPGWGCYGSKILRKEKRLQHTPDDVVALFNLTEDFFTIYDLSS